MLNKIYYFGVGSLHSDESSVDGGKYIRLPLMIEMMRAGYDVEWIGYERDEKCVNHFLDLLELRKENYIIDVRKPQVLEKNFVIDSSSKKTQAVKFDEKSILFIELRPDEDKPGYNFKQEFETQLKLIDRFHENKMPIFVWDQDVWAYHLPLEYRKKVVLLRSYFEELDETFPKQELFLYGWFKPSFDSNLSCIADWKRFDVNYCGNVYGRREEFLEFFKPFHEQNKKVCVQGNWLRKKYDDRDFALDNFPNFMFFGKTPHWSTLPTIAMSRSVIQFSNEAQQKVGLPTARIFETLMGKSIVFCSDKIKHIDRIVPEQLIFSTADDLMSKWERICSDLFRREDVEIEFERKLKTPEMSYRHRVVQLGQFVEKYYGHQ